MEPVLENQKLQTYGAAAASSMSLTVNCSKYVCRECTCQKLWVCWDKYQKWLQLSLCTCGTQQKDAAVSDKGVFRVFSFRNAWNTWFISEIMCWWLSGLMYLIYKANLLDSNLTSSWYVRLGQYNQRQRIFWQCTVAASRRGFRISLRQVCSQLGHSCITVYMMIVL